MVVPDEPAAGADPNTITTLQIRCPDGSKLLRKFNRTNTIAEVMNFAKVEKKIGINENYVLATTFPNRTLSDTGKTLAEIGLGK